MRRREVHLSQQKHVMFHGISDRPVQKITSSANAEGKNMETLSHSATLLK